ncbi:MFS transporter [Streptomyces samsunensis]|uniref:MFS transporter n=1 Tax=Streptomyces malaysiensis TaxID=92644 RepID=A0ABX6VYR2_STRMQ|nr:MULTISPECIES: MFS transporter [Streptomyces]MYU11991.1 MFS transporter [Streptomyces sp. SID8361]ATL80474.1 multi-drug efflux transporter [Streptomyces malaysiensis]AUA16152.1 Tetracycline resistance protein, class B [Streptomyces sp. M56]MCM3804674.1 MFS transporter [Streptomyces sp. DR7-3]MYX58285.1 MFS transporter [Streptomyces sp. SID8382]
MESRRNDVSRAWPYLAAAYAFVVTMCGTTLPTPLYSLYQREFGFSSFMVTVIFAVYAAGVIVALLLLGSVSDFIGRRPVMLAALVLSALSAVCFLLARGLPELFAGRTLSGLSAGLATGTATVTVIELAPPSRRRAATLLATGANLGGLGVGPLLAGVLAQYAPAPLKLVFVVDLVLVAVAAAVVLALPETVRTRSRPPLRPQRLRVPKEMRSTFAAAAMAGFAGFATLGLFTSVSPTFLSEVEGESNLAVAGAVAFSVFAASIAGQVLGRRLGPGWSLPGGCAVLVAGMAAIAVSLAIASLALLVLGAVVAGTGQGLSFHAAVRVVTERSPADRRAEVTSALFVLMYLAISIPVIGVGALTVAVGLRTAGLVFTGCVALLAVATLLRVRALSAETADR